MKKIISVFNHAGGVGKTTAVHNLATLFAASNFKTLAIDLDPQASLTDICGFDSYDLKETIGDLLVPEEEAPRSEWPILKTAFGFDIIPANLELEFQSEGISGALYRERRLLRYADEIMKEYEVVLIDCRPALGILTHIALAMSTDVLVPVQTHAKATIAIRRLVKGIHSARKGNPELEILGFLPCFLDRRRTVEKEALKEIIEKLSPHGRVFSAVPNKTDFVEAYKVRVPLAYSNPTNLALGPYKEVVKVVVSQQSAGEVGNG